MKNKQLLLGVLPLTLLLCLGACNQNKNTNPSGGSESDSEPQKREPQFITELPIPTSFTQACSEKGSVQSVAYKTKVYDINGEGTTEVTKRADVYLPYGYDEDKAYNVLYLMHGGGETYTYWLTEQRNTVNVLDNIFYQDLAEPCIVVAPTFYTGTGSGTNSAPTDIFQYEFRNDLIPFIEYEFSTYCGLDVSPEKLISTREHRGFAGLSMGSMTSIRSALLGCLDICAYISSMSGGYDASDNTGEAGFALIQEALTNRFKNYPVKYWINQNGTSDMALTPHENLKNLILSEMSDMFVEGENFSWIKFNGGSHDYRSWIVGLYNTLQVFF